MRADADVVRVETLALPRTEVVAPEAGTTVAEAVAELAAAGEVVSAEPDAPRSAFKSANDYALLTAQWQPAPTSTATHRVGRGDRRQRRHRSASSTPASTSTTPTSSTTSSRAAWTSSPTTPTPQDGDGPRHARRRHDRRRGRQRLRRQRRRLGRQPASDARARRQRRRSRLRRDQRQSPPPIAARRAVVNLSLGGDKAVSAERAADGRRLERPLRRRRGQRRREQRRDPVLPLRVRPAQHPLRRLDRQRRRPSPRPPTTGATTVDLAAPGRSASSARSSTALRLDERHLDGHPPRLRRRRPRPRPAPRAHRRRSCARCS